MFTRSFRRVAYLFSAGGIAILGTLLLLFLFKSAPQARATPVTAEDPSPTIRLVQVAEGFNQPTSLTNSGVSGDKRLFITEKEGLIQIITGTGNVLPSPFLNITTLVRSAEGERGLLGLTFDPDYANNGYFYVNYTYAGDSNEQEGDTRVSRFQVNPSDPNLADPNSELVILKVSQPITYSTHKGGDLAFGPDGYLYIPLGDGGGYGDPDDRAQDLASLLGKILRIDVSSGSPYSIPPDNPYVGQTGAREEIWASGLRNPWRLSFDRDTGDMYLGDVGQDTIEEINYQEASSPGGENYGWRCYEGTHTFNTANCGPVTDYDPPAIEYSHAEGRAVIGGYVYRGSQFPGMVGHYFFADFVFGRIWSMVHDGVDWRIKSQGTYPGSSFTSFGDDINGEVYLVDYNSPAQGSGVVYRLEIPDVYLPMIVKSDT